MAAVTVTKTRTNIIGSKREKTFTVNIATTGDTLVTGLKLIEAVSTNNTAVSLAAPTGGTVAFTISGATTGTLVRAVGY